MSKSYYKVLCLSDQGKYSKYFKRFSNKKNRKNWNIPDGGSYKKNGLTYDICDWKYLCFSKEEAEEAWFLKKAQKKQLKQNNKFQSFSRDSIKNIA